MPRTLTCYAWGRENQWEALCVDFDLAVTGSSFEDVRRRMGEVIQDYLASVALEAPEVQQQLLGRRAPWHVRLAVDASFRLSKLKHRFGRTDGDMAEFHLPCHA